MRRAPKASIWVRWCEAEVATPTSGERLPVRRLVCVFPARLQPPVRPLAGLSGRLPASDLWFMVPEFWISGSKDPGLFWGLSSGPRAPGSRPPGSQAPGVQAAGSSFPGALPCLISRVP